MAWAIEFDTAAQRELNKLDPTISRRILKFLLERVAKLEDPRQIGERLQGKLHNLWKYRVGITVSSVRSSKKYWLSSSLKSVTAAKSISGDFSDFCPQNFPATGFSAFE
jgi:hypothetical protein